RDCTFCRPLRLNESHRSTLHRTTVVRHHVSSRIVVWHFLASRSGVSALNASRCHFYSLPVNSAVTILQRDMVAMWPVIGFVLLPLSFNWRTQHWRALYRVATVEPTS